MKPYDHCEFEWERLAFAQLEHLLRGHPGAEIYPNFHLFDESVSDCVDMYQNGQDENGAFFWHQICCGSRL